MSHHRDLRSEILSFLESFVLDNGYAPTYGEISEAVGLSSRSHAAYYLGALEEDGLVVRKERSPRSLRLTHRATHHGANAPARPGVRHRT